MDGNLTQKGVDIFHSAQLASIEELPDRLKVRLDFNDGHQEAYEIDALLFSVGRTPLNKHR